MTFAINRRGIITVTGPNPPVFDAVTAIIDNTTGGTPNTKTFSHTCTGTNRALIVSFWTESAVSTLDVTYAGVSMTLIGSIVNAAATRRLEQWKLSNPASGANSVVITVSTTISRLMRAAAASFTNAHQTTASLTGTQASAGPTTSTTVSVAVSSGSSEIVIDAALLTFIDNQIATVGADQTQRWDEFFFADWGGSTEPGAGSVTMSWTLDLSVSWVTLGVSVKAP